MNQKGFVLLSSVVLLFTLIVMAGGLISYALVSGRLVNNYQNEIQRIYDAGSARDYQKWLAKQK